MRKITCIHVHHSAADFPDGETARQTIREWHIKKGWSDIGYNTIIAQDGVFQGRPCSKIPASIKGHNVGAIAICVSGMNPVIFVGDNNLQIQTTSKGEKLINALVYFC